MPPVSKAKSAFLYYQSTHLKEIKDELKCSMGAAMTELSSRWKALSQEDREPYFEMEAQDRERFQRESAVADAKAMAEQNARRENLIAKDGEDVSQRGERRKIAQERQQAEEEKARRKARIEAETDPEILAERRRIKEAKKAEARERQRKRDLEEKKLEDRHKKLDKEQQKKEAKRLEFLLSQSSIFGKLKSGKGSATEEPNQEEYVPHHRDKKSKKIAKAPVPEGEDGDESIFEPIAAGPTIKPPFDPAMSPTIVPLDKDRELAMRARGNLGGIASLA